VASFTITPLTDHTGAEVNDPDFARPTVSDRRATLNRGFIDHQVLVMRDQHVNEHRYLYRRMLKGEVPA